MSGVAGSIINDNLDWPVVGLERFNAIFKFCYIADITWIKFRPDACKFFNIIAQCVCRVFG